MERSLLDNDRAALTPYIDFVVAQDMLLSLSPPPNLVGDNLPSSREFPRQATDLLNALGRPHFSSQLPASAAIEDAFLAEEAAGAHAVSARLGPVSQLLQWWTCA